MCRAGFQENTHPMTITQEIKNPTKPAESPRQGLLGLLGNLLSLQMNE